jgi:N-acetylmuramoyl-L-alanine amidase
MKFASGYDNGTIDKYDQGTNGVGIVFGKYGIVWFNADAFIKL